MGTSNKNLRVADKVKYDEFYTDYTEIECELNKYVEQFQGKSVYCNCDDPKKSAFWKYFHEHFTELGLIELVSTYFDMYEPITISTYKGGNDADITAAEQEVVFGIGDFRNPVCESILDEVDIVCTNPPFSLFGEFVGMLQEHHTDFLIIGNKNCICRNDMFHWMKDGKVRLGYTQPDTFYTPEGKTEKMTGLCRWYTTLHTEIEKNILNLSAEYDESLYPKYENYDAIEVKECKDIPKDYDGVMGVPITFFDKYCPEQFEILGRSGDIAWTLNECDFFTPPDELTQQKYKKKDKTWRVQNSYLVGKNGYPINIYYRVFIRRKVR